MKRRLNVVFLGWLVLPLLLISIAGYALWYYQITRNAWKLLELSKSSQDKDDLEQAALYLQRFLNYKPDDTEALTRYGFLIDKGATTTATRLSALPVLERALRQLVLSSEVAKEQGKRDQVTRDNNQAAQVRRALGDILLEAGTVNDEFFKRAQVYFDWLTNEDNQTEGAEPDNPDFLLKKGMAHGSDKSDESHFVTAMAAFDKVLKIEPENVDASLSKAVTMRFHKDPSRDAEDVAHDADSIVNDMVEAYPSARSYLARLRYRSTYGDYKGALQDARKAVELDPDNPSAMVTAAILEFEQVEDVDKARTLLRKAMTLDPKRIDAYTVLIQIEKRYGRFAAAEAVAREGIQKLVGQEDTQIIELYWTLANTLIDAGARDKAESLISSMKTKGTLPLYLIAYLDGRMLMLQSLWSDASDKIDSITTQLVRIPRVACDALIDLATCYKNMASKDPSNRKDLMDKCISSLNSAIRSNPGSIRARVALAQAQIDEDDSDDRETKLRKVEEVLSKGESSTSDILILRARIAAGNELRKPATMRNWRPVEEMLKRVEDIDPDSPQLLDTWVQVNIAQGKPKLAEKRLDAVISAHPEQPNPRVTRAMVAQEQGLHTEAVTILDQADLHFGPRSELFQGRIRYIIRRGGLQTKDSLLEMIPKISLYPEEKRGELTEILAAALTQIRDNDDAMKLWKDLTERHPDELRFRTAMFDLAFRTNDNENIEACVQHIRKLEGEDSLSTLFAEAGQQIVLARSGDSKALAKAKNKIEKISRRRKNWSRLDLLNAEIAEAEKDSEAAISHYKHAIENGERQLDVVRRLVQLLYDSQRYDEADAVIRDIESRPGAELANGDVKRVVSDIALGIRDPERAVTLARQAVSDDSTDFRDFLWLGQVYMATDQLEQAEEQFEKAVSLGSETPETWVRLAAFHFRNKDQVKAEAVLERALRSLPPEIGTITIAQCYENLGRYDKADVLFRQALATKADDPATLRAIASSWMRQTRFQDTEPLLRHLLNISPSVSASTDLFWVRRSLAVVLINLGGSDHYPEAIQLVEANLLAEPESTDDLFAQAMVQSSRADMRHKAIETFHKMEKSRSLEPNETLLFCRVLEAENDWPQAHDRLIRLASLNKDRPDIIAPLVASLIRQRDLTEARPWIELLNQIERNSSRCATLTAQYFQKSGQSDRALKRIQEFVQANPGVASSVVSLLDELGGEKLAEPIYVKMSREAKTPDDRFALALFYGRHGRINEAINHCDSLRGTAPDEQVVLVALNILAGSDSGNNAVEYQRIEKWINDLEAKGSERFDPRTLRAAMLAIRGDVTTARDLYYQVLESRPKDYTALNNLAWLLALTGNEQERQNAIPIIEKAIQLIGPKPTLLDTRAIVFQSIREYEKAEHDLQLAIGTQLNPVYLYHLACVQLSKGNKTAAKDSLQRAMEMGLSIQTVDPLERSNYRQVISDLQAR